jgi:5-formyltetrahydrofolate cyclo-ligase
VHSRKSLLRNQMVLELKKLEGNSELKKSKELEAAKNLHRFLIQLSVTLKKEKLLIGGYHPIKSELNWLSLLELGVYDLAFPAFCAEGVMEFYLANISDLSMSSEFGTKMMCPKKESRIKAVVPDCLLIPGLAFSQKGVRLGRGAGYFDRYLENYHGARVGICFTEQLIDVIPQDPHDQHMNFVVTDDNFFKV